MSTNKANIHKLNSEFNHYYQTIVIAFDIENIVLITYTINAIKRFLNIGKTGPLASFHNGSPFLQSYFCIRMRFCIFF